MKIFVSNCSSILALTSVCADAAVFVRHIYILHWHDCSCIPACACLQEQTVCEILCMHVFVCTGVKLTCPGSLSIRGSCAHTPWTRGEDAWSSCLQWTHAVASPSLTSVQHHSTNHMRSRTSWRTTSVPVLLYCICTVWMHHVKLTC